MNNNRNLFVIAIIAIVNALGYGIIIPILYTYSQKFGLTDFENGLLFAMYSVCQFISTPIIGRLSDKYGRKPMLIISLAGTAISFVIMAFAPSAIFLFLARALDGITAGNIPVASAVISDTTAPKDRARGFGIIGASFGFGFIFGPAISAFTVGINESIPFIIAAVVSLVAVIATFLFLPETNTFRREKEIRKGKMFDFGKLLSSVTDEAIGTTLVISLIYSFAFSLFIYVFQPYAVEVLTLSAQTISVIFTVFGAIGLVSQTLIIPFVAQKYGEKTSLITSLGIMTVTFFFLYIVRSFPLFLIVTTAHALANGFVNPMVQTLLSKEMDEASQGSILGLNASYVSIGMIFGPIIGGALTVFGIPFPFLAGSITSLICTILSLQILRKPAKEHAAF